MMRIVRANNRTARRKRERITVLRDAVGKRTPFCYVEYKGNVTLDVYKDYYSLISLSLYSLAARLLNEARNKVTKRVFPTYAKAMAHLTALKLNACDEDEEYKSFKPCKIVQGYYTISGKEVIEKTQDISDERDSVGRDDSSSGQLRQQRRINLPVSQAMGTGGRAIGRSSRTTTRGSSITEVDTGRHGTWTIPSPTWEYGDSSATSLI